MQGVIFDHAYADIGTAACLALLGLWRWFGRNRVRRRLVRRPATDTYDYSQRKPRSSNQRRQDHARVERDQRDELHGYRTLERHQGDLRHGNDRCTDVQPQFHFGVLGFRREREKGPLGYGHWRSRTDDLAECDPGDDLVRSIVHAHLERD